MCECAAWRVIGEIRLTKLKLGDEYIWSYYSSLEICSSINTEGRMRISLCLSDNIIIIIAITITIIITYHVPSIKTVTKKIHMAPDLRKHRVSVKDKLKVN